MKRPRRRTRLAAVAVVGVLSLAVGVAWADNVGINPGYVYYTNTIFGTKYCAAGGNDLYHDGSGYAKYDSFTMSLLGGTCGVPNNSYSITANVQLIYWVQGSPTNCGGAGGVTTWGNWYAASPVYANYCGPGTYSATTVHSAWIGGYNAGAILSSGYHNF